MFASALAPGELSTALLEYARKNRAAVAELRSQAQQLLDTPNRAYQDALTDHGISMLEAEAAWAERTAQKLASVPEGQPA
jgi:hypothetical protein